MKTVDNTTCWAYILLVGIVIALHLSLWASPVLSETRQMKKFQLALPMQPLGKCTYSLPPQSQI